MNKGNEYWNNNDFNLIELANTQRAITNFVKILTNEEIPVEFTTTGDSMTDGKSITISSKINQDTLDFFNNSCGEEINVKIDYGNNPIDDMINKLKLMGYVVFKKGGSNA